MLWFLIGLLVGATLGAVGMGILAAGKKKDYSSNSSTRLRSDRYSGGWESQSRGKYNKGGDCE